MRWLLFFYSVPSKPVSNRMRIWRRLSKAGAIQLKGAVYALPYNEEHCELFQWLVSEVTSMKGDSAFVKVEKIETMKNTEFVDLFNLQRKRDYRNIEEGLEELGIKINSVKKGAVLQNVQKISEQLNKYFKEFEEVKRIDFFSSKSGDSLIKRIKELEKDIKGLSGIETKKAVVIPRRIENYQGRIWITRKKPFVDRIASAWIVRKFIDKKPVFKFIEENEIETVDKNAVLFDIRGGEFTHSGALCTFEVLLGSFGIKDKVLKKIAEIVHDLDIRDDLHENPESKGIEEILRGIRKTAKDDAEVLKNGMEVFEMLYASKTKL